MAQYYCIMQSGMLEVYKEGNKINEIQEGEGFGDAALFHECKRTATVTAKHKT